MVPPKLNSQRMSFPCMKSGLLITLYRVTSIVDVVGVPTRFDDKQMHLTLTAFQLRFVEDQYMDRVIFQLVSYPSNRCG